MKISKSVLLSVVLAAMLMTSMLFIGTGSVSNTKLANGTPEYDPWKDINDDGYIEMMDFFELSQIYMASGTPINKTALLLELQDKIESLNASFLDLEAYLETRIATLNASVAALESRITTLEAPGSVTNIRLAAGAIPFNSTYSETGELTTSMQWIDMPSMSVDLVLARNSNMLIMFSADAGMSQFGGLTNGMSIRALVNSTVANPQSSNLGFSEVGGEIWSFTYLLPNASAGVYTIKIQWKVGAFSPPTGWVDYRTLSVIALPA